MHWLFLLLAAGAFALAVSTTKLWLLAVSLLAALVFVLLWAKGLYVARFGDGGNAVPRALHPSELAHMREQLKKKQQAATADPSHTPQSHDP